MNVTHEALRWVLTDARRLSGFVGETRPAGPDSDVVTGYVCGCTTETLVEYYGDGLFARRLKGKLCNFHDGMMAGLLTPLPGEVDR